MDTQGRVEEVGEGILTGPFNPSSYEEVYSAYPSHMPNIRHRVENAVVGKIVILTCDMEVVGEAARRIYYAVVGVA